MKKKTYYVEFGQRGGFHSGSGVRMLNKTDAAKLAADMVMVFEQDNTLYSANWRNWYLQKKCPRQTWTSCTHFVALSVLNERNEGPATPELWRKEK